MSTLKVNTINNLAGQINVGKVITIAKYTDYTNLNTTSSSYVTAYTFPNFTKKYDSTVSSIYGFCSISSLWEGSEQQEWQIMRSSTLLSEIRHKNSNTSGWGMHSFPINFEDTSAAAGSISYFLRVRVVNYAYYNYPTAYGNCPSHYTLMEVLN